MNSEIKASELSHNITSTGVLRISLIIGMVSLLMCGMAYSATAQEVEIRRWNQLPIDQNFGIFTFAHTSGNIDTDPALELENTQVEIDTWVLGYVRSFELFDKTARLEVRQSFQDGTWNGILSGQSIATDRSGMNDTVLRLAVNLLGSPPLTGQAYADYRATINEETIIGIAMAVSLPTGQYFDDKLINLGSNRFSFRPQVGFLHRRDNWAIELTGTAYLFSPNDDFFGGQRLARAPLFSAEGSIEYDFDSGVWIAAGAAVATGGRSTIDGVEKQDKRLDLGWMLSAGVPINRSLSFKANYIATKNFEKVGITSHSASFGFQWTW